MDMFERHLIERSTEGDIDAFALLMQKYHKVIYGLAFHLLRNFDDAQDITQDVFIEAFQNLGQLRDHSKFASWIRGITVNLCRMWLRRHTRTVPLEEIDSEPRHYLAHQSTSDPAEEYENIELQDTVRKAVNSLSEKNRLVVTLYYTSGMSYKEIAAFLGVPVTTVEGRMHRARKLLKEEMIEMAEEVFADEARREPKITVKELLEAGIHFGHSTSKRNPKMSRYILTEREARDDSGNVTGSVDIFDLKKTLKMLTKAYSFVRDEAAKAGTVLFAGVKKQAQSIISEQAERCGMPFINTLEQSVEFSKMERLPDAVIIIDVEEDEVALIEARKHKIPVVAIVDSKVDPECIGYPIPGNDDAVRSIRLICTKMADAVLEGARRA